MGNFWKGKEDRHTKYGKWQEEKYTSKTRPHTCGEKGQ